MLEENGFIYLDTYTGQYCITDEAYVDGPPGVVCPDCGNVTETISESNYYFRLSAFEQKILELIDTNAMVIEPATLRNEVLSFVRSGLKDLSISRTSITWGIPVPGHPEHVIYVWLDALANYMTAVGYGSDAPEDVAKFEHYWPADLHLIGKEIARFHCVYWPAFLMAADLPLPKKIAANGWLLFHDSKMSKSKGNVVRIETILDGFGEQVYKKQFPDSTKKEQDLFAADVLRYFLLREIPFGQDGSFTFEAMVTRYNADLANGYGNLVSRTLAMIQKYFDGVIPAGALQDGIAVAIREAKRLLQGSSMRWILRERCRRRCSWCGPRTPTLPRLHRGSWRRMDQAPRVVGCAVYGRHVYRCCEQASAAGASLHGRQRAGAAWNLRRGGRK